MFIPGKISFETLREFNVVLFLRRRNQRTLPFAGFFALSHLGQCERHGLSMLCCVVGCKDALG